MFNFQEVILRSIILRLGYIFTNIFYSRTFESIFLMIMIMIRIYFTLVKKIIIKHTYIHKCIIKQEYYIITMEKIFTYERGVYALGICRYILALVTMSLPPSSRDPCLVEDEFPPRLITANAKSNRFIEFHLSTVTAATAFS